MLSLVGLIVRETRYDNPLINFRTLKDRNFLRLLRDHFLRVRYSVREQREPSSVAPIAFRLRRYDLGAGALASGNCFNHRACDRRLVC